MLKEKKVEEKIIKQFVPARAIESPANTHPYARLNDKLKAAIRRFLSNESFTEGMIADDAPRLIINKATFDSKMMGYNVVARVL